MEGLKKMDVIVLNLLVFAIGAGQVYLLYQLWQVHWSKYLNRLPLVAKANAAAHQS